MLSIPVFCGIPGIGMSMRSRLARGGREGYNPASLFPQHHNAWRSSVGVKPAQPPRPGTSRAALMKTYTAKNETVQRDWYVVDAEGKTLGRLSAELAHRLRGKHKPIYTPHVDAGDYMVVINAEKIVVTGKKLSDKKYHRFTGYIGNLKTETLAQALERHPERVIAVSYTHLDVYKRQHLARAADQPSQLLSRDPQLGALRMAHRVGFLRQVVEGPGDAVGDIEEGQAAGLATGVAQAARQLTADPVQEAWRVGGQRAGHQLEQLVAADFGQLAGTARAQGDFAPFRGGSEQAHLADEFTRAEVAEDQFAVVVFLGQDADRAVDDVIQGAGGVTGAEDVRARGVATALGVLQEPLDGRAIGRERAGLAAQR